MADQMTAQERAKAALCFGPPYCRDGGHDYECCYSHGSAEKVAAAIEAAEAAAYERAAGMTEAGGCVRAAERIRALAAQEKERGNG